MLWGFWILIKMLISIDLHFRLSSIDDPDTDWEKLEVFSKHNKIQCRQLENDWLPFIQEISPPYKTIYISKKKLDS